MGQKNTTHKVWAKSETMRAGPLCRYFGAYMELLLSCYNNLIMLFEQDDKLCKQNIKSFEQHLRAIYRGYVVVSGTSLWLSLVAVLAATALLIGNSFYSNTNNHTNGSQNT